MLIDWAGPCEIMFDSGAFTAWSKGAEVHLDTLIGHYTTLLEKFEGKGGVQNIWLISLDKIPGRKGHTATPAEIDEAVRISDENYAVLSKHFGTRVLPVFHQNESQARLLEVAKMNHYICVSPRNDLHEKSRVLWSKSAHALLPPEVKTHGLAATGSTMMREVPWHSVDSARWLYAAFNGTIFADASLRVISISNKAGATMKQQNMHFSTFSPAQREHLLAHFDRYGFTLEALQDDMHERAIYNRTQLQEAERMSCREVAAALPVQETLFDL
jgi:DUF971 family protein